MQCFERLVSVFTVSCGHWLAAVRSPEAISEKAKLPQPFLSEQVYPLPSPQFIDLSFFLVIRQPTCFGNPGFMVQEPLKARPVCSSLIWEKHFHCLWVGKLQLLHLSYCFPFQKFCEGTEQKDNYLFRYCARSIYWGVWMWSVMFWRYRTGSNHNSWSWD